MRLIAFVLLVLVVTGSQNLNAWEYEKSRRLDNSAVYDQHPENGFYHAKDSVLLTATLIGTADVDIYLYTYKQGEWQEVAKSNNEDWNEILMYQAKEDAWYAWFVVLKSPNTEGGDYTLMLSD